MGHVARGSPQIPPETGPRLLVGRGAPLEGSSYEALLGRRENNSKIQREGPKGQSRLKGEGHVKGRGMCWDRLQQAKE